MKKYMTVFASFMIMLCTGSIYAWSMIASELMKDYGFSALQSQIIFSAIMAIFPTMMIFVGRLGRKVKFRHLGYISGILFITGYVLAGFSHGNFAVIFLGIGVISGIATAFGYWLALTAPVQWFPERKGLITGIAAAGFGLGAVLLTAIAERILAGGKDVMQLLKIIGLFYGAAILILSNLIFQVPGAIKKQDDTGIKIKKLLATSSFRILFFGILLGTFAGLLIVGSLKVIGETNGVSTYHLLLSISIFAAANFLGRISWGALSDHIGSNMSIFLALLLQSAAIILLNIIHLNDISYLVLIFLIGFGYGGNFVLFAKETAELFGVNKMGLVYPYVLLGYAIAGILGPVSGGLFYDIFGSFYYAIFLSAFMSLAGSLLFLREYLLNRQNKRHIR